jgi:radical SAM protein with 4Fe4S-binding SPASM domain
MDAYGNENRNLEFYVQWHFIDSCNLRCIHCYQENYNRKDLDFNKLKAIFLKLDEAMEKWKMKCFVSLTGGEPFLQPEGLFYLMDLIENSDNFISTAILTNGTLLTEDLVKKIKDYKKLAEVQVSLDGNDEESHDAVRGAGTFSRAVEAVKLLKDHGIKTVAMFTLHKKNIDSACKMPKLAASLNLDALTVERMTSMSLDEKEEFFIEADQLKAVYSDVFDAAKIEFINKNTKLATSRPLWNLIDSDAGGYCPAGLSSLCILYDGVMLPCRRLYLPLGNILTDGLFKVWYNSDILWKLRKKSSENECVNCSHLDRCGGCKAASYSINNDINSKDPQCWNLV